MDESIQFLLTLQSYDMRASELMQKLAHLPGEIETLDRRIKEVESQWLQKKEKIKNLNQNIRNREQDLQSIEDQVAKDKYKLALTKNPQEYAILSKKIDANGKKIETLEEELIAKLMEFDGENAQLKNEQSINGEKIEGIKAEKNGKLGMVVKLKENGDEIGQKIKTIRQVLLENHPHWLERYDRAQKAIRKMPCIVHLKNDQYCGGCNLKLSGNNFAVDGTFPFAVCESCARLILIASEEIADSDEDEK
jgi:predicted  nucleic acid-binding Zn-ribbon protein